ncbi:hypothetical protein NODU109028_17420 [Nocardioides dubius]|uniref:Uncharacterized protein n=1 Tax=Nocardioides dubius TaxID=317019 RepID=A0ABN1TIY6_9ACTN
MTKFEDSRLLALNAESGFLDNGMRAALLGALEDDERACASYSVSAHIWVEAVLTDRALLFVKGAVRARAVRVPLPVDVVREPSGSKSGARVRTPFGEKTLWGSKLDPNMTMLLGLRGPAPDMEKPRGNPGAAQAPCIADPRPVISSSGPNLVESGGTEDRRRLSWRERLSRRWRAGRKPRKPRLQKAQPESVGQAPNPTIWDVAYDCIKCGRPLTNPDSQRHRVGTECIQRYGSQARMIRNPAYSAWENDKARAEIDRIARQVELDSAYSKELATYDAALAVWNAAREDRA